MTVFQKLRMFFIPFVFFIEPEQYSVMDPHMWKSILSVVSMQVYKYIRLYCQFIA